MKLDQFQYAVKEARKRSEPWARSAVLCTHCKRNLVASSAVVVASQHCEFCGGRVTDEGEYNRLPPEETTNRPTAQQFIAAAKPYILTLKAIGAIGTTAIVFGCSGCTNVGQNLLFPNKLWAPWVNPLIAGWTCCVLPFLIVAAIVLVETRAKWDPTTQCQNCSETLAYTLPIVVATRCCPLCGEQHLRDNVAPLDGSTAPLITLSAYLSRAGSTIRCPHCRKKPHTIGHVIASKHCDRCGGRMIADPSEPDPCR